MADFFENLNKINIQSNVNEPITPNPYARKKGRSRTIQLREDLYLQLRELAYRRDVKLIDVLSEMVEYSLTHNPDYDGRKE